MDYNIDPEIFKSLKTISLSMFRKNFFGIFHGSISTKLEEGHFLINRKDAIFDDLDEESFIMLYHKRDYRWNDASMDAFIHSLIYQNIPNAKYIAYGMPPFAVILSSSLLLFLIFPLFFLLFLFYLIFIYLSLLFLIKTPCSSDTGPRRFERDLT